MTINPVSQPALLSIKEVDSLQGKINKAKAVAEAAQSPLKVDEQFVKDIRSMVVEARNSAKSDDNDTELLQAINGRNAAEADLVEAEKAMGIRDEKGNYVARTLRYPKTTPVLMALTLTAAAVASFAAALIGAHFGTWAICGALTTFTATLGPVGLGVGGGLALAATLALAALSKSYYGKKKEIAGAEAHVEMHTLSEMTAVATDKFYIRMAREPKFCERILEYVFEDRYPLEMVKDHWEALDQLKGINPDGSRNFQAENLHKSITGAAEKVEWITTGDEPGLYTTFMGDRKRVLALDDGELKIKIDQQSFQDIPAAELLLNGQGWYTLGYEKTSANGKDNKRYSQLIPAIDNRKNRDEGMVVFTRDRGLVNWNPRTWSQTTGDHTTMSNEADFGSWREKLMTLGGHYDTVEVELKDENDQGHRFISAVSANQPRAGFAGTHSHFGYLIPEGDVIERGGKLYKKAKHFSFGTYGHDVAVISTTGLDPKSGEIWCGDNSLTMPDRSHVYEITPITSEKCENSLKAVHKMHLEHYEEGVKKLASKEKAIEMRPKRIFSVALSVVGSIATAALLTMVGLIIGNVITPACLGTLVTAGIPWAAIGTILGCMAVAGTCIYLAYRWRPDPDGTFILDSQNCTFDMAKAAAAAGIHYHSLAPAHRIGRWYESLGRRVFRPFKSNINTPFLIRALMQIRQDTQRRLEEKAKAATAAAA